jgi:intracellular sulfur oxidation DsrE/DsrF family protein
MGIFGLKEDSLFEGVEVVRSGFEYHILKVMEGFIPIYL